MTQNTTCNNGTAGVNRAVYTQTADKSHGAYGGNMSGWSVVIIEGPGVGALC